MFCVYIVCYYKDNHRIYLTVKGSRGLAEEYLRDNFGDMVFVIRRDGTDFYSVSPNNLYKTKTVSIQKVKI